MSNVRIYFENGIPDKEIIRKWTEEFSCFHSCEVVIRKETDNKTMFVEFEDSYSGVIYQWDHFFNKVNGTWISMYAIPDLGEGEGYAIYKCDNKVSFSYYCVESHELHKDFLSSYRSMKLMGFGKEYRRFDYHSVDVDK